ncbi:YvrJ family protein [Sporosarcina sp. resist]|nr:YvrJ family protein [Sporosarcina sp. resist]
MGFPICVSFFLLHRLEKNLVYSTFKRN